MKEELRFQKVKLGFYFLNTRYEYLKIGCKDQKAIKSFQENLIFSIRSKCFIS